VRICDSCHCPAAPTRENCPFCGADLLRPAPVAFSLERRDGKFEWYTDGALVASASGMNGLWQLCDARGSHVVSLVPIGDDSPEEGVALVGPNARLLGSIRPHEDNSEGHLGGSVASDPDGRPVLVLRGDGGQAAHLVDRRGDIVAVASWEDHEAATDLLVTPLGTRHSLAMVFGLLLSLELSRNAGRLA
jgi:rRNA maturation protein Nop10